MALSLQENISQKNIWKWLITCPKRETIPDEARKDAMTRHGPEINQAMMYKYGILAPPLTILTQGFEQMGTRLAEFGLLPLHCYRDHTWTTRKDAWCRSWAFNSSWEGYVWMQYGVNPVNQDYIALRSDPDGIYLDMRPSGGMTSKLMMECQLTKYLIVGHQPSMIVLHDSVLVGIWYPTIEKFELREVLLSMTTGWISKWHKLKDTKLQRWDYNEKIEVKLLNMLWCEPRQSVLIVLGGHNHKMQIQEYSCDDKQWRMCNIGYLNYYFDPAMLLLNGTADILCCGGYKINEQGNNVHQEQLSSEIWIMQVRDDEWKYVPMHVKLPEPGFFWITEIRMPTAMLEIICSNVLRREYAGISSITWEDGCRDWDEDQQSPWFLQKLIEAEVQSAVSLVEVHLIQQYTREHWSVDYDHLLTVNGDLVEKNNIEVSTIDDIDWNVSI